MAEYQLVPPSPDVEDAARSARQAVEPHRILIVEDDLLVAMQAEAALIDAGFEVTGIATSAAEAVELAVTHPVLVLMDIRLAGEGDGIDAALRLYTAHQIRCIFATAHHDPYTRRRAEPACPLGWLQKPYSVDALVVMVRRAVRELTRRDT